MNTDAFKKATLLYYATNPKRLLLSGFGEDHSVDFAEFLAASRRIARQGHPTVSTCCPRRYTPPGTGRPSVGASLDCRCRLRLGIEGMDRFSRD